MAGQMGDFLAQRGHTGQPLGPIDPGISFMPAAAQLGMAQAILGQIGARGTQSQHGATRHCFVVESIEI
jgi:hypothetical protein